MKYFKLKKTSTKSKARLAILKTTHGNIETPFFMPIATKGAIKSLTIDDIKRLQAQIILANTYHLYLRPGEKILKKFKGLHDFMKWPGPLLTDSGGFQVFSLDAGLERKGINKSSGIKVDRIISDQGVEFRSYLDGSKHFFSPQKVIQIQKAIGSDIMMVLDECVANPTTYDKAAAAVQRTTKWAAECLQAKKELKIKGQLLFGIVQGSLFEDLRKQSAQELIDLQFDGYAIGGLAVGEANKDMYKVLDYTVPELPSDKPRYLMGVGYPENIIEAVKRGIDMFDCVIPTREARHGRLYKFQKTKHKQQISHKSQATKIYETINILNSKFAQSTKPINEFSKLLELREYSLGYLHHLFKTNEPLAIRLATLNNIEFYLQLMSRIRQAIKDNNL